MKLKKTRLLSLIMAAALVFESAGINVAAASNTVGEPTLVYSVEDLLDVTDGDVSTSDVTVGDVTEDDATEVPVADVSESDVTEGDVSENDVTAGDVTAGDVTAGDVTAGDVTAGDVTAGDVTEGDVTVGDVTDGDVSASDITAGDVTAGDVTEGDVSGGNVPAAEMTLAELFPGLPSDYVFTATEKESKAVLAQYTDEIAISAGEDTVGGYADGELVYLAETAEEAQMVADAFGGTLDSFELGVALIRLAEDRTVTQAVLAAAQPDIMLPAVWPNHIMEYHGSYNDPYLSDVKHSNYQWQHNFVGSYIAWDSGYTGKGVNVGIIDSGVLSGHEEFSGRVKKNIKIAPSSSTAYLPSQTTISNTTTDPTGHGTHVAGIVAAAKNNSKGGAGIAPDANIYAYSCGDADGIYTVSWMRALNQAVLDGVQIVNMSFGSIAYNENSEIVIQNAYESGVAIFASAGNDAASSKNYPACYKNVCSIASLQQDGKKSSFSCYNDEVDLAFPGSNIYSTYKNSASSYVMMSGTSQAAPVATGVAAVILSGANDLPALKDSKGNLKTGSARVDALYSIMKKNAKKSGSKGTGAGTTQLDKVFGSVKIATPTFNVKSGTVGADLQVVSISCASTNGITIYYNKDGKTPSFKKGVVQNGTKYTGAFSVGGKKTVTVKAIAVNHATGKASKAATLKLTFKPNPSGIAVSAKDNVNKLAPGKSVQLKAVVTPDYAISKKVKWSVDDATKANGVTVSSSGKVSVSANAKQGNYYIYATVVDSKGNAIYNLKGNYLITVLDKNALIKSIAFDKDATKNYKTVYRTTSNSKVTLADKMTESAIDLGNVAKVTYGNNTTASGAAAGLIWSSSNNAIAAVNNKGVVSVYAPGKVTIKAMANDGSNKSTKFTITVKQIATDIDISGSSTILAAGKSMKLTAIITPTNTSAKKVTWDIMKLNDANKGKVTVKNGKVTASKDATGTWRVLATTALSANGYSQITTSYDITVYGAIKSITMDKTMTLFAPGTAGKTSQRLAVSVSGGNGKVAYSTSNKAVADVDQSGVVTAKGKGTAVITCAAQDGSGKKATCKVTVAVPMSSLTIVAGDDNDGYVCEGVSIKLAAVAGDSYGTPTNKNVVWSVYAGSAYVSVNNKGVVTAKKGICTDGMMRSATIKAVAADGSGATGYYDVTILPEIKSANLKWSYSAGAIRLYGKNSSGSEVKWYKFTEGGKTYVAPLPMTVEISGPKNMNVGIDKWLDYDQSSQDGTVFGLYTEKPTTKKTSAQSRTFTTADAVKVNIKVKIQGSNKSVSHSLYLIHTSDEKYYTVF